VISLDYLPTTYVRLLTTLPKGNLSSSYNFSGKSAELDVKVHPFFLTLIGVGMVAVKTEPSNAELD